MMFEAVIALCLAGDPEICRDTLVPGHEAGTHQDCAESLARGVDLPSGPEFVPKGQPRCQPTGPVAAFIEAAPGVFAHLGAVADVGPGNGGDVSNAAFIIGAEAVAMVDSGGSRQIGEQFYRAIRQRTDLPVRYLILTHMHPDHVLGASVFADAGAQIVGHRALPRALADRAGTYLTNFGRQIGAEAFVGSGVVSPDRLVDASETLDLGGRILHLQSWPTAHTSTDLTVADRETGTLITGDLVFDDHTPALDGSLLGWQAVMADLAGESFARIIPGHGGPVLDWPAGAAPQGRYLDVLTDDTRAAIAGGATLGEAIQTVAQGEADRWRLFELFNPRNATVAYTELEWE